MEDMFSLLLIVVLLVKGTACRSTTCPDGYHGHQGSCYLFSRGQETWIGAVVSCTLLSHGMLVEINSADEDAYISNEIDSIGGDDHFWIGLHDKKMEGTYIWATSETPLIDTGYTKWGHGEPDGKGSQNCVFYSPGHSHHKWADGDCTHSERYICETRGGNTSATIIG